MKVQDDMQEDRFGSLGVANERRNHFGAKILQLRTTKTQYSPQYSMEDSSKVSNENISLKSDLQNLYFVM